MEDSDKVDSSTPTSGGSDSEEAALDDSTGGTEEEASPCGGSAAGEGMESGSESRRVPRMPKRGACEPLRSPAPNTICIASDAASSAAAYFNARLTKFR